MNEHNPLTLPFCVDISPTLKIRAIIAQLPLEEGDIIEKCPIILVDRKLEEKYLQKTVLWRYYYEWNKTHHCIVLGYGSLINHSYTPNARYSFDYRNKLLVYRAIKHISPGEEITVNYAYEPNSTEKLDSILLDYNSHHPS